MYILDIAFLVIILNGCTVINNLVDNYQFEQIYLPMAKIIISKAEGCLQTTNPVGSRLHSILP